MKNASLSCSRLGSLFVRSSVRNQRNPRKTHARAGRNARSDVNPTGSRAARALGRAVAGPCLVALATLGARDLSKTTKTNPLGMRRTCLENERFASWAEGGVVGGARAADPAEFARGTRKS